MPKIDGVELSKAILTLRPTQRIILATAYPNDACNESSLTRFGVELLSKPFRLDTLVDLIERKIPMRSIQNY